MSPLIVYEYFGCKLYLELFGYLSIVIWFAYGLYRTKQRVFVSTIGILFLLSQWAMHNGNAKLDMALEGICIALMLIKQWYNCHEFAVRERNHRKPVGRINTEPKT